MNQVPVLDHDKKHQLLIDIFRQREAVLKHLNYLVVEKIIDKYDILALFRYAIKEEGIADKIITQIVLEYIILISNDITAFNETIQSIRFAVEMEGNTFI